MDNISQEDISDLQLFPFAGVRVRPDEDHCLPVQYLASARMISIPDASFRPPSQPDPEKCIPTIIFMIR
jgi:hypothetical protein